MVAEVTQDPKLLQVCLIKTQFANLYDLRVQQKKSRQQDLKKITEKD